MMLPDPFHKQFTLPELLKLRKTWQEAGERVVFTNGVFDLIHPGHVLYLKESSDLGDRLIVGLNSDASVRMLNKGDQRPIQDETARAIVLSAMECVDAVVIFSEETPLNLITSLLPDTLVKGGDYTIDQIVGAQQVLERGGEVKQLRFIEGYSTTAIEQKIRNNG